MTREKKTKDYLKGYVNNPIYVRRAEKNTVTIPSMDIMDSSLAHGSAENGQYNTLANSGAKVRWREPAQKDEPFEQAGLTWQKSSLHQEYHDRDGFAFDRQLEQQHSLGSSPSLQMPASALPLIRNYRTEIDSKFLERGVKNSDIGTLASVNSGIAIKRSAQNSVLQSWRRGQSQVSTNKFGGSRHGSLPSLVGLGNSSATLPQSPAPKRVAIAPTNATSIRTQARAGSQLQLAGTKTVAKSRLDLLDHGLEDTATSPQASRALDSSAAELGTRERRSSLLAYADRSTDKRKQLRKAGTTDISGSAAISGVNMPTLSNQDVE